jgi:hypothetical protein
MAEKVALAVAAAALQAAHLELNQQLVSEVSELAAAAVAKSVV